ncbi:MAG: hypothetical protein AUH72_09085 [Acidobacteria bacterium 13_1_40CM_4_65_8]|nr:MAG: hypothetical protein AUH72_09085 [Acidobacteria bacterium 13_1_40CM_4_65_8]
MTTGLFALLLLQAAGAPLDEGVLVVRVDTLEVARESFRISHGRLSRGEAGWTLATTIRYDRARPVIVLAPILEVNGDTLPATLQYDVADPRQPSRILGELGRGRFTVRLVARATERAREFATGRRTVVLDDSVFALYVFAAWQAASEPAAPCGATRSKSATSAQRPRRSITTRPACDTSRWKANRAPCTCGWMTRVG